MWLTEGKAEVGRKPSTQQLTKAATSGQLLNLLGLQFPQLREKQHIKHKNVAMCSHLQNQARD
jgi:predicted component of type VI protein secretion system